WPDQQMRYEKPIMPVLVGIMRVVEPRAIQAARHKHIVKPSIVCANWRRGDPVCGRVRALRQPKFFVAAEFKDALGVPGHEQLWFASGNIVAERLMGVLEKRYGPYLAQVALLPQHPDLRGEVLFLLRMNVRGHAQGRAFMVTGH